MIELVIDAINARPEPSMIELMLDVINARPEPKKSAKRKRTGHELERALEALKADLQKVLDTLRADKANLEKALDTLCADLTK